MNKSKKVHNGRMVLSVEIEDIKIVPDVMYFPYMQSRWSNKIKPERWFMAYENKLCTREELDDKYVVIGKDVYFKPCVVVTFLDGTIEQMYCDSFPMATITGEAIIQKCMPFAKLEF